MAFFRFTRDRRGYENFYLVEPMTNRRGKSRTRVLYWYRTPPNIKVGRAPFDEQVQRALEAQNPTVSFDWPKIVDAPIPSAEAEMWRERRRVERAEKAARQTATADEPPADEPEAALLERIESTAEPNPSAAVETIRRRRRRRGGRGERAANAPAPAVAPSDTAVRSADTPDAATTGVEPAGE